MSGLFSAYGVNLIHAAKARFEVYDPNYNWVNIGLASGIQISNELPHEEYKCINQLETAEFIPIGFAVRIACKMFAAFNYSLRQMGIQPSQDAMASFGEMSVRLYDISTENSRHFIQVNGVKYVGGSLSVEAGSLQGQDIQFIGKRIAYSDFNDLFGIVNR